MINMMVMMMIMVMLMVAVMMVMMITMMMLILMMIIRWEEGLWNWLTMPPPQGSPASINRCLSFKIIIIVFNQIDHSKLYSTYLPASIKYLFIHLIQSLWFYSIELTCLNYIHHIHLYQYVHHQDRPIWSAIDNQVLINSCIPLSSYSPSYTQASSSSKTSCSVESCASLTLVLPTPKSTLFWDGEYPSQHCSWMKPTLFQDEEYLSIEDLPTEILGPIQKSTHPSIQVSFSLNIILCVLCC